MDVDEAAGFGDVHIDMPRPRRVRALPGRIAAFIIARPLGAIGGLLVVGLAASAMGAQWLSPYDPLEFHYESFLAPPGPKFILGTDQFGRDILSRVIWGARTSLYVGLAAVVLGQVGGGMWGLFSAYVGGKVDMVSQRAVDVVMVFPTLVLALTIVAVLGSSVNTVILAISLSQAPGAVRTIRASALGIRATQYVEAAKAVGCSDLRVMRCHIFPNVLAPLIVVATAALGSAILAEASLSFLGFGVPPPQPSWGGMMSGEGRRYLVQAPWMTLSPGIVMSLTVYGFNLLGDALRDAWDPQQRRR